MDETSRARKLVQSLSKAEFEALQSVSAGESVRDLARRLSTDILAAAEIKNSMKLKLGAAHDADAVRVAICAGIRAS